MQRELDKDLAELDLRQLELTEQREEQLDLQELELHEQDLRELDLAKLEST